MAIRYKVDVLALLKNAGYNQTRIRSEKILGQSYMSQLRKGELVSWAALNKICALLDCQPGDILEYIPDEADVPPSDYETDVLREALLNQIKNL